MHEPPFVIQHQTFTAHTMLHHRSLHECVCLAHRADINATIKDTDTAGCFVWIQPVSNPLSISGTSNLRSRDLWRHVGWNFGSSSS